MAVLFVVVAADTGPFHLLQADGQLKSPSLVTPANRSAQCVCIYTNSSCLTLSAAHLETAECKQVVLV